MKQLLDFLRHRPRLQLSGIQGRLTLVFMALAAIPLLVVGVILGVITYNVQLQQALSLQAEISKRVSVMVQSFIQGIEAEIRVVIEVQGLMTMSREQQDRILGELLSHHDSFEDIILLDAQGREQIHRSASAVYAPEDLGDRSQFDEFKVPQETLESYYSPIEYDPATSEPFMTLSVPVVDIRTQTIEAVLVAKIRTKPISNLIAGSNTVNNGESIYIVDAANRVVVHRDPSVVLRETSFIPLDQLQVQPGLDNGRVVLATSSIQLGAQKLTVVAEKDSARALNLAITTIALILGLSILAALVASIVGFLLVRQIVSPIKTLAVTSQTIAGGDLDLSIAHHSKDEIGQLADAFRQMITYLQAMSGAADRLAVGDVTARISPQSERDALGNAFQRMIAYQQTMSAAAERLAAGDITAEIAPHSEKDVLGNAFARMIANLRELIGEVAQGANNLGSASEQMAVTAEQVAHAIAQVSVAISEMSQGAIRQIDSVTQTVDFAVQMSHAIEGVARGAQEQAVAVGRSAEITHLMSNVIEKVASNAMTSAGNSTQATQLSRVGAETVTETIRGMESIKSKVGLSAQRVEEMGQHSERIGIIVETINDIASQTNLLSLNAAIEASRAGEHGKGFAVVADEIRRLANKSSEATKEIAALVRSVQKTVTQTVQAMNEGVSEVTMGVGLANKAGQAMLNVLTATENVNRQMEEIAVAAQQMDDSATELVNAMNTVSAVVEENTAATEEMAANSDEVASMARNIAGISEENSASAEEIAATIEEVNAQVEEVAASVQVLNQMAQSLQSLVGRFVLPAK
ncbi:MAG: methyl-accepting chemotaxis protein [Anaerolineae bacterium]|nr:methyl-accepting chemotaxis protein [Anaerolineae bacterium]